MKLDLDLSSQLADTEGGYETPSTGLSWDNAPAKPTDEDDKSVPPRF